MKRNYLLLVLGLVCLGNVSCSNHGIKSDKEISALTAGDATALVEGCGNQIISGYTYCRVREGEVANASLTFIAPPVECVTQDPNSCVHLEIYFPNGNSNYAADIPKGQTRISIPWKTLVKRDTFEKSDRGFWPFRYTIKWMDKDDREQSTVMEGEIRMRVVSKAYISLHEMPKDPNFVWTWIEKNKLVEVTTGGRVFVGAAPVSK
jgi:hypothetical protein